MKTKKIKSHIHPEQELIRSALCGKGKHSHTCQHPELSTTNRRAKTKRVFTWSFCLHDDFRQAQDKLSLPPDQADIQHPWHNAVYLLVLLLYTEKRSYKSLFFFPACKPTNSKTGKLITMIKQTVYKGRQWELIMWSCRLLWNDLLRDNGCNPALHADVAQSRVRASLYYCE